MWGSDDSVGLRVNYVSLNASGVVASRVARLANVLKTMPYLKGVVISCDGLIGLPDYFFMSVKELEASLPDASVSVIVD